MTAHIPRPPVHSTAPVYLVELFGLQTGSLESADVCGQLNLALESVYWHLLTYGDPVIVQVSADEHNELQGISFFHRDESFLASITAYRLDREREDVHAPVSVLRTIAQCGNFQQMQTALNQFF